MLFSDAALVSAAAVEVTAGTSTGVASTSTRVSPSASAACRASRTASTSTPAPGNVGGHGVGRCRGVERDRGVDGLDEEVGCGLAEGFGRGRRVDPHSGARGVGEPRRDVPHRALAERAIDQGLRVERGAEFRPGDLGLAVCAHEHDRGLGELPLHGIRRGAGREPADRDTGDGGSGSDEDE